MSKSIQNLTAITINHESDKTISLIQELLNLYDGSVFKMTIMADMEYYFKSKEKPCIERLWKEAIQKRA